jgi:Ca-activated chloride channel family protein
LFGKPDKPETPMNRTQFKLFACGILFILSFGGFTRSHPPAPHSFSLKDTIAPLLIKARDHQGKMTVTTSDGFTLSTGMHNDFYPVDSVNKTAYFYIEVKLQAFAVPARRVPLNLSIVIDRSGSMQGIKMGYAKRAAKEIIRQLQPDDYVSVVMYDNAVDSVQPPVKAIDKALIQSRIDKIIPRGGTDLWGGTDKGYSFVQRNYNPGFVNRVLLISDGLANVGLTDSNLIRLNVQRYKDENGITLSTFGVGLDYNERLMTDMAETGLGNYYFIDTPEKLTGIFDKELSGMLNIAARDAEIRIQVPKGVQFKSAYPLRYSEKDGSVFIGLRDLFSNDVKAALLTFAPDNKINVPLKFITTLSYTDIRDGQKKKLVNENLLSPAKNADAFLTHYNKRVVEQTILFTANENLEKAMSFVDRGDMNAARKSLDANKAFLKANARYVDGDGELMRMDSLNTSYSRQAVQSGTMNVDTLKKIQKLTRAGNYRARNKKQ